jgi:predicted DNA-binding transcriptional regulator AlpA
MPTRELTTSEVSSALGISESETNWAIRRGDIPRPSAVGGRRIWSQEDVRRLALSLVNRGIIDKTTAASAIDPKNWELALDDTRARAPRTARIDEVLLLREISALREDLRIFRDELLRSGSTAARSETRTPRPER